jgi:flavodoxin I
LRVILIPPAHPRKTLIVYDSVYGNTEKVARAIGGAIAGSKVVRAGEADYSKLKGFSLLIVGSPTHGGRPTEAVKDFLSRIPENALRNISVASFDTSMSYVPSVPFSSIVKIFLDFFGYATGRIANNLEKKGGLLVAEPECFIVKGREGPLKEGELERAAEWGRRICKLPSNRVKSAKTGKITRV